MKILTQSVRMLLLLTLLLGFGYTFLVTILGAVLFHHEATGSLLRNAKSEIIGSKLLAQKFENPKYFWPRPSSGDFASVPSGASNLGPTSAALKEAVEKREKALRESNSNSSDAVPEELLFTSASGLDPHISPKTAVFQVDRIVKARNLNAEQKTKLLRLIDESTKNKDSWLGDPIINVLLLNLALDQLG
ncbi:MAG: potassium-transporting ATPase subunit KdpC [Deltaproteobacteria bacterium]|nr:potassium-transporting ATPase subunit KdpC [Deltaproteobacteria bacterium]